MSRIYVDLPEEAGQVYERFNLTCRPVQNFNAEDAGQRLCDFLYRMPMNNITGLIKQPLEELEGFDTWAIGLKGKLKGLPLPTMSSIDLGLPVSWFESRKKLEVVCRPHRAYDPNLAGSRIYEFLSKMPREAIHEMVSNPAFTTIWKIRELENERERLPLYASD